MALKTVRFMIYTQCCIHMNSIIRMKCIIPEYISFINLKIDECLHFMENQTCMNMAEVYSYKV